MKTIKALSPFLVLTLCFTVLCGCNKVAGNNPVVSKSIFQNQNAENFRTDRASHRNIFPWGICQVVLNKASNTSEIIPLRNIEFTCDVTQFLQHPIAHTNLMSIEIDPSSDLANGHAVVDVSLTHPFPGLDVYTGFDVRGVVIGNGSISGIKDTGIVYAGADDLRLLNADGLTRWFNPKEFTTYESILGFTRGKMGSSSTKWTATLNGYKYFCTGLDKQTDVAQFFADPSCSNPRGYYTAGSKLTRRYDLQFPVVGSNPVYEFQYAVIASWEEPIHDPPTKLPDDFIISANCQEPFAFSASDESDLYYINESTKGGNFRLLVRVFDHQGINNPNGVHGEISAIHLEIPGGLINTNVASFDSTALNSAKISDNGKYATYLLQTTDLSLHASGNFPVMVVVESSSPDGYFSGYPGFAYPSSAKLSGYFQTLVHVKPYWHELAPMNHPRHSFTEQAVDGKIYVFGGLDAASKIIGVVECYDTVANTWTDVSTMPTPLFTCSSATVGGLVYVFGGNSALSPAPPVVTVEVYNPVTHTWTYADNMPSVRAWPMAEAISDQIYVTGGWNGSSMLTTCLKFDPDNPGIKWIDIAPMPIIRSGHDVVAYNGKIYSAGGYDGNPMLRYDPSLNIWTGVAELAPMPTDRLHLRLAIKGDSIYATGGCQEPDVPIAPFTTVEIYHIDSNFWTTETPLPVPLEMHGAITVNDIVYIFGGMTTGGAVSGKLWKFVQ